MTLEAEIERHLSHAVNAVLNDASSVEPIVDIALCLLASAREVGDGAKLSQLDVELSKKNTELRQANAALRQENGKLLLLAHTTSQGNSSDIEPKLAAKKPAANKDAKPAAQKVRSRESALAANPGPLPLPAESSSDKWTTNAWLTSLNLTKCIATAMLPMSAGSLDNELGAVLSFVSVITSEAALAERLEAGGVVTMLARELLPELRKLAVSSEVTGDSLHSKFVQEGNSFTMKYGSLSTFFGGLEAKIGAPNPKVREGMAEEHTAASDSKDEFTASNYGLTTTPEVEWRFVVEPDGEGTRWPVEDKLRSEPDKMRKPMLMPELLKRLQMINGQLEAMNEPSLMEEEAFGARLYTGPMFVKYNDLLRGFGPALKSCKGNRYVTTTHVINSAIIKASKLTRARKVYRGVAGGVLPESFWAANEQGVKGGIESAFMSTTFDRSVAMHYASMGSTSLVFEMQMGMIDRGCELGWISQYPHEAECLFAPLTGLEVQTTRVDGAVLVIECRLSINLNALTIEQVVAKRRKLLVDMGGFITSEVRTELFAEVVGQHRDLTNKNDPIIKAGPMVMMPTKCLINGRRQQKLERLPLVGNRFVREKADGTREHLNSEEYGALTAEEQAACVGPIAPPVDAFVAEARVMLTQTALRDFLIAAHDAEFFNTDEHFIFGARLLAAAGKEALKFEPAALRLLRLAGAEATGFDARVGPLALQPLDLQGCTSLVSINDLTPQDLLAVLDPKQALLPYGCIPEGIEEMQALATAKLYVGGVSTLPEALGRLSSLTTLEMTCQRHGQRDAFMDEAMLPSAVPAALPSSFEQLSSLETLTLAGPSDPDKRIKAGMPPWGLALTPHFGSGLCALKTLTLDSIGLQELPEGLCLATNLQELYIRFCESLCRLPESFGDGMQQLTLFYIILCPSLRRLPENFGRLRALSLCYLFDHHLEALPSSIGQLGALEELNMRSLQKEGSSDTLEALPPAIGPLASLKKLTLDGAFRELPADFGELAALEELHLTAPSLTALPESFGRLTKLEVLECVDLRALTSLPDSFGGLLELWSLKLGCPQLSHLPWSFGGLTSLRVAVLAHCDALRPSLPQALRAMLPRMAALNKLVLPDGLIVSGPLCDVDLRSWHEIVSGVPRPVAIITQRYSDLEDLIDWNVGYAWLKPPAESTTVASALELHDYGGDEPEEQE